jgi:uncharacterized membrane protein HdeD (DUF308 family)
MNAEGNLFTNLLSKAWWKLLLRGIAAILFAILAWTRPGISLAALILVFAVYVLTDGILATWTAIAGRKQYDDWWVLLLGGLIGVAVGLLSLAAPGVTAIVLVFYIATWSIVRGVIEIVAAVRLRREIRGEWLLITAGVLSLLFGALLFAKPGAGALAVLWLIAAFVFISGLIQVMLAFKVRKLARRLRTPGAAD